VTSSDSAIRHSEATTNVAIGSVDQRVELSTKICSETGDRIWDQDCDTDRLWDSRRRGSSVRIFGVVLLLSLIAHTGALFVLSFIRPAARRASQENELIYLIYTPSTAPPGRSSAGASGTFSVALRPAANAHTVAMPRHEPRAIAKIKKAIPKARATPRPAIVIARKEIVTTPAVSSMRGLDAGGAGAGRGDAKGSGASSGGAGAGSVGGNGSGGDVFSADQVEYPPVLVSRVMPQFPESARADGINGEVVLWAIVARDGHVEKDIAIAQSSPMFDRPAIEALRRWRFEPGRDRDGHPVRVMLEVPIRFQLR